jgi:hypothetical protein
MAENEKEEEKRVESKHNCPYLGDLLFRLPRFSPAFTEESGASETERERKDALCRIVTICNFNCPSRNVIH